MRQVFVGRVLRVVDLEGPRGLDEIASDREGAGDTCIPQGIESHLPYSLDRKDAIPQCLGRDADDAVRPDELAAADELVRGNRVGRRTGGQGPEPCSLTPIRCGADILEKAAEAVRVRRCAEDAEPALACPTHNAGAIRVRRNADRAVRSSELAAGGAVTGVEQCRRSSGRQAADAAAELRIGGRAGVLEIAGIAVRRDGGGVDPVVRCPIGFVASARTPIRLAELPITPMPPFACPTTAEEPVDVEEFKTRSCCVVVVPCSCVGALTELIWPRLKTPPTPLPAIAAPVAVAASSKPLPNSKVRRLLKIPMIQPRFATAAVVSRRSIRGST